MEGDYVMEALCPEVVNSVSEGQLGSCRNTLVTMELIVRRQWFSTFLMLRLFNIAPHTMVTPNHKIFIAT